MNTFKCTICGADKMDASAISEHVMQNHFQEFLTETVRNMAFIRAENDSLKLNQIPHICGTCDHCVDTTYTDVAPDPAWNKVYRENACEIARKKTTKSTPCQINKWELVVWIKEGIENLAAARAT